MTDHPLIRTKIVPPRRRADLLRRPRLLEQMYDLLNQRLVIITAPAGYGKTALLIDLVDELAMPVAWYSLDEQDADWSRFIEYLVAALSDPFPPLGERIRALLTAGQTPDVMQMVGLLVNALVDHVAGHFVIVLDDYHLVEHVPQINQFVSQLVQQARDDVHLVLASRMLPPLPNLPLLVGRGWVGGLSFEELAFRPDEVQSLLWQNHRLRLGPDDAEAMVQESEGWITGVLLSAQTMGQAMLRQLQGTRRTQVDVYDFLAQQVLDQQPPEVRDFLLRTSLMESFDVATCQAVLGEPSGPTWRDLMTHLRHDNLFVTDVGDQGQWLRYHHLFREFLQAQLERERPTEADELRRRLADWYVSQEEWERAHALYGQVGDGSAQADLVEQAGSTLIKQGRIETLARWLEELPPTLRHTRPTLLSLQGATYAAQGQLSQALIVHDEAVRALRRQQRPVPLARALVRRAWAYRAAGDYEAARADAEETLSLAEAEESLLLQASAWRMKGQCFYFYGQINETITALTRALTLYKLLNDEANIALLQVELGSVHTTAGQHAKAMVYYEAARPYWEQAADCARLANLFNSLAVLHHLSGDYRSAIVAVERGVTWAQRGHTRDGALLLTTLGDIYFDIDALAAAQEAYRRAQDQAQQFENNNLLVYLMIADAMLALRQGRVDQARYTLATAGDTLEIGKSLHIRARLAFARGWLAIQTHRVADAVVHLSEAVHLFESASLYRDAASVHLLCAVAHREQGDEASAQSHLDRALQLATTQDSVPSLVTCARLVHDPLKRWMASQALPLPAQRLLSQVEQFNETLPSLHRQVRRVCQVVPLDPPALVIQGLNANDAWLNSEEVDWGWSPARDFLFCLLVHPDGLSKEEVGERLWPDCSVSQLKSRFKDASKYLRRALGPDSLLYEDGVYRFNDTLDYEYDVYLFDADLDETAATSSPGEQRRLYERALRRYEGPFAPDLEGDWVVTERARLHERYLEASIRLMANLFEAGAWQATLDWAANILRLEPTLERVYRWIMRVHAARGRPADVVRTYEQCVQVLRDELDVPPSEDTRTLYRSLLAA